MYYLGMCTRLPKILTEKPFFVLCTHYMLQLFAMYYANSGRIPNYSDKMFIVKPEYVS